MEAIDTVCGIDTFSIWVFQKSVFLCILQFKMDIAPKLIMSVWFGIKLWVI